MSRICFVFILSLVYQASALSACSKDINHNIDKSPVKNVLQTIYKYNPYVIRAASSKEISAALKCVSVRMWQPQNNVAHVETTFKFENKSMPDFVNKYIQTEEQNGLVYERDIKTNVTYTIRVALLTHEVIGYYRCLETGTDNWDSGYCAVPAKNQDEKAVQHCVSKMKDIGITTITLIPECTP